MDQLPRLLALIGSGETAAQMTRGHRMLMRRLAGENGSGRDVRAAVVDTPYGFQSNADGISAELLDYFGRRIGMKVSIASLRRSDADIVSRETAYKRIAEADFVFSGPGSPSYALRHWAGTEVPTLFAEKLLTGGALVLASAAALTMGRLTLPVYEIYKAGEDPYWLPGLDVLSAIGIAAAVLPHYDNSEGGGHDTRFCYLGEQRLLALEEQLPDDVFIVGIDEHSALLIDLDEERAYVHGRGGVTVRQRGESAVFATGEQLPLSRLQQVRTASHPSPPAAAPEPGDTDDLARRLIELESQVADMSESSRLADGLLALLVDMRQAARSSGDFAAADAIRDRIAALGLELTDSVSGTTFVRRR